MPSMIDPELNLGWAKKHLDDLNAELSLIDCTKSHRVISAEDDPANGWYVITVEYMDATLQFSIALRAGDFISRLRSSLDHLAWQLALFTTDKPGRHISFPLYEKDSLETQIGIVKATYGIPDKAVAIMKLFQPYNAGDLYKTTHLWRLNKLWNIDKHRHITPHGVASDWLFKTNGPMEIQTEMIGNHGIMRIPLALKDKVEFNPNVGPAKIRFEDRTEGIDLGIEDFFEMHQYVADTVFPAFAGFFQ